MRLKHVVKIDKKIEQVNFGSQSDPDLSATWNLTFWEPVEPMLLFSWMVYAPTWQDFIYQYPTIRMTSGNSIFSTYVTTQWGQYTSSGAFPVVNTNRIEDQSIDVILANSEARIDHGNQYVNFGIVMNIYRESGNIYATFELDSASTFTDVDNCAPGSSASAYIGDITLG